MDQGGEDRVGEVTADDADHTVADLARLGEEETSVDETQSVAVPEVHGEDVAGGRERRESETRWRFAEEIELAIVGKATFEVQLSAAAANGTASFPITYGGQTGLRVQVVWVNNVTCVGSRSLSSSAGLAF